MSKPHELNKVLSRIDVIVLAFGAMTGWGWVVLSGNWIQKAGSMGSIVAFMFVGFNIIPQMAEEMNIPKKTIGKVLLLSVALAVLWYILIIFGVSFP